LLFSLNCCFCQFLLHLCLFLLSYFLLSLFFLFIYLPQLLVSFLQLSNCLILPLLHLLLKLLLFQSHIFHSSPIFLLFLLDLSPSRLFSLLFLLLYQLLFLFVPLHIPLNQLLSFISSLGCHFLIFLLNFKSLLLLHGFNCFSLLFMQNLFVLDLSRNKSSFLPLLLQKARKSLDLFDFLS
jgi:hypothetical protein